MGSTWHGNFSKNYRFCQLYLGKRRNCCIQIIDDICLVSQRVSRHWVSEIEGSNFEHRSSHEPRKVFSPTAMLSVMGIVSDAEHGTFSVEPKKLDEIHSICLQSFFYKITCPNEISSHCLANCCTSLTVSDCLGFFSISF